MKYQVDVMIPLRCRGSDNREVSAARIRPLRELHGGRPAHCGDGGSNNSREPAAGAPFGAAGIKPRTMCMPAARRWSAWSRHFSFRGFAFIIGYQKHAARRI